MTACKSSIGLNPFFLPASFNAFSTIFWTDSSSHKSCSDLSFIVVAEPVEEVDLVDADDEEVEEEDDERECRRCASCGMIIAIGRDASGVACTQILDTRLQDL